MYRKYSFFEIPLGNTNYARANIKMQMNLEKAYQFNFNGKTFALIQNSDTGKVNTETIFKYKQRGTLVTADYFGGGILYGKIIAKLDNDKLHMLYQCLTAENELKAGKALATISLSDEGMIKLNLNWEWLTNGNEKGKSEYLEIDQ